MFANFSQHVQGTTNYRPELMGEFSLSVPVCESSQSDHEWSSWIGDDVGASGSREAAE